VPFQFHSSLVEKVQHRGLCYTAPEEMTFIPGFFYQLIVVALQDLNVSYILIGGNSKTYK
jgi:hypothetical protein